MTLHNNNKQSSSIQPAKFNRPTLSPKRLTRVRLFNLLDQSKRTSVTSLQAPAGFGKSLLVADWLISRGVKFQWYNLDLSDNQAECFLRNLQLALQPILQPELDIERSQRCVQNDLDLHQYLAEISLNLASVGEPLYLIFDQCDLLTTPSVAQALTHWLRQLPQNIHVFLLWQNSLPVSLAHFKVRGDLTALNAQQLAFTCDEVQQWLGNSLNSASSAISFGQSNINQWNENLAGWPAAWAFFLQVVKEQASRPPTLAAIGQSGLDDYLIHEVLLAQPEKLQILLLRLSLFEQFNAGIAAQLVDFADAESLILELQRRQLFIFTSAKPIESKTEGQTESQLESYYLAPCFRQALVGYLKSIDHQGFKALQQQAVEIYLQQGQLEQAVNLALVLKNEQTIIKLLRHSGSTLYQKGQVATLSELFELIPIEQIKHYQPLALLYAWVLLASYREQSVTEVLHTDLTASGQAIEIDRESWAEQAVAQAQAAVNAEDFELAKTLAEQAYKQLPAQSALSRTNCFAVMGQIALCQGNLEHAVEFLTTAESLAYEHEFLQPKLWSLCLLSDAYWAQGKLEQAREVQQKGFDMAANNAIGDALHMEYLYRNRIHLCIEQGDLSSVEKLILKSEQVIEPIGRYGQLNLCVHRGMIALWRKQRDSALRFAQQVNRLLQNHDFHSDWLAHAYDFLLACQCEKILDFKPHLVWQENRLTACANNHFYQHYQRSYALYCWQQGDQQQAVKQVEQLLTTSEAYGLAFERLKNKLLLCIWQNDQTGLQHWQAIEPSLSQLKPLQSLWFSALFNRSDLNRNWPNWQIWFLDQGQAALPRHQKTGQDLLARLNQNYANAGDLVTLKELQVLMLIGTGLSNEEISAKMHIALSTVKSHIRRLYRKLGVSKRSQAVELFRHL